MIAEKLKALFILADITVFQNWEALNPYWRDNSVKGPLLLMSTPAGMVSISWRKRVIEIDWSATKIRTVITADEVTKDEHSVHAYSYSKALEYLAALSPHIREFTPVGHPHKGFVSVDVTKEPS